MEIGPIIKNPVLDINKLVRQGTMLNQGVQNVEGDSTADQATVALLARKDPVIHEIAVGMSGDEATLYTVSGTPPLSLPNSLGKPLKAWSVELSPYQEGTGDPSPTNVRPIHGTDKLTIYTDSKYGGLVDWNQLVNGYAERETRGLTIAESGNGYSVVGTVTTVFDYNFVALTKLISFRRDGRKYLITVDTATLGDHLWRVAGYSSVALHNGGFMFTQTAAADWNNYVGVNIELGETVNDTGIIGVYDLTQMFGATKANEIYAMEQAQDGAGVAYFRSLFPLDYYPYNAGQQMTVDQVNGAQYSPAVLTLPQTVYTATIGSGGEESRWGEVDLGTLNWHASGSTQHGFYATLPFAYAIGINIPAMCEAYKYAGTRASAQGYYGNNGELTVYQRFGSSYASECYVVDENYSDAASFTASVQGVKFVAELADPTTFAVPSVSIPTPTGTATTWATAEDGIVDTMEVTYIGKA